MVLVSVSFCFPVKLLIHFWNLQSECFLTNSIHLSKRKQYEYVSMWKYQPFWCIFDYVVLCVYQRKVFLFITESERRDKTGKYLSVSGISSSSGCLLGSRLTEREKSFNISFNVAPWTHEVECCLIMWLCLITVTRHIMFHVTPGTVFVCVCLCVYVQCHTFELDLSWFGNR